MRKTAGIVWKIIAAALVICVTVNIAAYFADSDAYFRGKVRLSTLNNEECKQFVLDQGIAIPEEFSDFNFQWLFAYIEENPDVSNFGVSWPALEEFSEAIRDAVIAYYGIEPIVPVLPSALP